MIRLALRLGVRLVARQKLRTLAVCCGIAVPIAIGTAIGAISATSTVSVEEARLVAFGAADGRISSTAQAADVPAVTTKLREALPVGSHTVLDVDLIGLPITAPTTGRRVDATGRALQLTDPLVRDLYLLRQGQLDAAPDTILLSRALAGRLDVHVGNRVTLGGGEQSTATVSGLIDNRLDTTQMIFVVPTTDAAAFSGTVGSPRWYVDLPPDSSVDAGKLGEAGFTWIPKSQAAALADDAFGDQQPATLIGVGLLAETVLLISAVFAVVVNSQRRDMGLLAALGAPKRVRAWPFPFYALSTATIGILVGALVGEGIARALMPVLQRRADADWGPFDPALGTVAVLGFVAACAAVAAIVIPTRRAVNRDVTVLLRDITPLARRTGSRIGGAAVIVSGLGAFLIGCAAVTKTDAVGILAALGFVAGVVGTSLGVLAVGARLGNNALLPVPASVRTAIRGLLGYPARTAITLMALAAVGAVGSVAVLLTASTTAKSIHNYIPALPQDSAVITPRRNLTAAELAALATDTKTVPSEYLIAAALVDGRPMQLSPKTGFLDCLVQRNLLRYGNNDWRSCEDSSATSVPFRTVGIADAAAAQRITRSTWNETDRLAYERGEKLAITSPAGLSNEVELVRQTRGSTGMQLINVARLPAIAPQSAAKEYWALPKILVSRATASTLNLAPAGLPNYLLARDDTDSIRRNLPVDVQADVEISTETGPPRADTADRVLTGIIAVTGASSAAIIIAMMTLWMGDLRGSFAMLGAVGASVRWRRATTATMAASIATSAAIIGTVWGTVSGLGFLAGVGTAPTFSASTLMLILVCPFVAVLIGAMMAPKRAKAARRG